MSGAPSTCLWCSEEFTPRASGGRAQKYCSASCRKSLHREARRWAIARIEDGTLPVAVIRAGFNSNVNVAMVRKSGVGRCQGSGAARVAFPLATAEARPIGDETR
jgi:hypothetical protein